MTKQNSERVIIDTLHKQAVKQYLQDSTVRGIYTSHEEVAQTAKSLGYAVHICNPIRNQAANVASGLVEFGHPKAQRNEQGDIISGRILHVDDTEHICLIVTDNLCTSDSLPEGMSLLASRSKGAKNPEEALQFEKL